MNKQMVNNEQMISSITKSLQQISNVLAHMAINLDVNNNKTQIELVSLLLGLGYDRTQIASILNTSVASITARIAELKKKG